MKLSQLEDLIMAAWITKEDIDLILWAVLDRKEPIDEDELSNLLIGVSALHNSRMTMLFQAYEDLIKDTYLLTSSR
jgi:beta-N-acetylglucosaminidase